ncbi:alpha/beta hydrolase [Clostridium sp. JN-1]|uniref:alpha/beta fold hydrolase n=1 Tax=Clostridium sp. JN-1 TaxID=2483110 RepID=UPI000F0B971C|nr:alpha/beta hydrolase [Clostridium sp. JN-1]
MVFKEFGNCNMPVIIFIHGGGLSWWSWKVQIKKLERDYHVIVPVIDGHGDDYNTTSMSIEKSAEKILEYINENCNGRVFLICGFSIGSQITVEILSRKCDVTENALVCPMGTILPVSLFMSKIFYGPIKKRWYSKVQAKALKIPDKLFETYYKDSSKMTKESLINMLRSNGTYNIPKNLHKTRAKVLIIVGEKELKIMRKSAVLLHNTIRGSILKVIPKSQYGEISLRYPSKYLSLLKRFFI